MLQTHVLARRRLSSCCCELRNFTNFHRIILILSRQRLLIITFFPYDDFLRTGEGGKIGTPLFFYMRQRNAVPCFAHQFNELGVYERYSCYTLHAQIKINLRNACIRLYSNVCCFSSIAFNKPKKSKLFSLICFDRF